MSAQNLFFMRFLSLKISSFIISVIIFFIIVTLRSAQKPDVPRGPDPTLSKSFGFEAYYRHRRRENCFVDDGDDDGWEDFISVVTVGVSLLFIIKWRISATVSYANIEKQFSIRTDDEQIVEPVWKVHQLPNLKANEAVGSNIPRPLQLPSTIYVGLYIHIHIHCES